MPIGVINPIIQDWWLGLKPYLVEPSLGKKIKESGSMKMGSLNHHKSVCIFLPFTLYLFASIVTCL